MISYVHAHVLSVAEEVMLPNQVEPVRWPAHRMRKVLNAAVASGFVGDDMIMAAEQALSEGFQGSLSRSARLGLLA